MTDKRLYFFMCTGQVAFYPGNLIDSQELDPSQVQMLVSNTVLFTEDGTIKVKDIGNVQQSLQMNVINRFQGQEPPAFLDVVILNISPLGHMTQQEFEAGSQMEAARLEQAAAEAEILKSAGIPTL